MSDNRRIFDDQLYVHFITFSCYRRRRLLDEDHPKQIVIGYLNQELTHHAARCIGFVVMPDHVHALVWFPQPGKLQKFMHGWKRQSSFTIRNWYREAQANYFLEIGMGDKFWQPKYYAFQIYSQQKLHEKLDYMHLNPVRAQLVARATDWKWSSARWYHGRRSVGVPVQWVE